MLARLLIAFRRFAVIGYMMISSHCGRGNAGERSQFSAWDDAVMSYALMSVSVVAIILFGMTADRPLRLFE